MNRQDFQRLADMRLREAESLLAAGHYGGAYYLAGYSVECALKACIAKQTQEYDFPDKQMAISAWKHDLRHLLRLAGLEQPLKQATQNDLAMDISWVVTKDWNESDRYDHSITQQEAQGLVDAISDPQKGILQWLKAHW